MFLSVFIYFSLFFFLMPQSGKSSKFKFRMFFNNGLHRLHGLFSLMSKLLQIINFDFTD